MGAEAREKCFRALIKLLMPPPVLGVLLRWHEPFQLNTDASLVEAGVVLTRVVAGAKQVQAEYAIYTW